MNKEEDRQQDKIMFLGADLPYKVFQTNIQENDCRSSKCIRQHDGNKIRENAAQRDQQDGKKLHDKVRQPEAQFRIAPAVLPPQESHNNGTDGIAD